MGVGRCGMLIVHGFAELLQDNKLVTWRSDCRILRQAMIGVVGSSQVAGFKPFLLQK
jgi:hypothetical protein